MKPNNTKLRYGRAAQELRKEAGGESLRPPHYHVAAVSPKKHMWLPIVKHSRDEYGVNLNALKKLSRAHGEQFANIRDASAKKPLRNWIKRRTSPPRTHEETISAKSRGGTPGLSFFSGFRLSAVPSKTSFTEPEKYRPILPPFLLVA